MTAAPRAERPVGGQSAGALVDRERARLRALLAGGGVALAVALGALLLAAGAALFADARWIALPRALPLLLWVAALAAGAGALALSAGLARRRATRAAVAAEIERERKLRSGALRGALEVGETGGALGRRALEQLGARLVAEGGALAPALRRRAGRLSGALAVVALAALALLAAASTGFADGWRAVEHPIRAWRGTLLPALAVDAPREVLRGERYTVRVAAPGRREVVVHSRATGDGWSSERYAVRDGRVELQLGPLRANTAFVVSDGRTASDTALVRATDRPFVGDVALLAHFPAYLGRAPEPVASGEVARLPRGTVLSISGRASTALDRIGLAHAGDTLALHPDGHRFAGQLVATTSGTWVWSARAAAGGPIADLPPNVELDVVPDSAPRIEILAPQRDSVVGADGTVALSLVATDDHGLASVALHSWRVTSAGAVAGESTDRLAQGAGQQWSGEAGIDLATRGLEPGDALHVVAVASDGSPWTQRAESRELVLRLPSLSEQRAMARRAADSAAAGATALASAEKALAQRTGEAARARGERSTGGKSSDKSGDRDASSADASAGKDAKSGEQALSYQRAEQARALSQEQRDLAEKVRQLQQSAKSLERQLKQAGALDSGLQSRLAEAQKLLQEALTPELAAQLQKLEQAAEGLDNDAARQAMGDLAQQQQRLREQLERSAEMLKRAALEGTMQTLRDEARELAQRQRDLADSPSDAQTPPPNAGDRGQDDSAASRDSDAREKSESAREGREDRSGADKSAERGDRSREAQELAQRSRDLARDVATLEKRLKQERADVGAAKADAAQQHAAASADAMQRAARGQQQQQQQRGNDQQSGQQDASRSASAQNERDAKEQRGSQKSGEQGAQQSGQQSAQRQGGQEGAQSGDKQQGAQQPGAQQQQGSQQRRQPGADAARQASKEMDQAAQQLADAREQQINDWKQELTQELDQSIQEMLQLGRSEQQLADQSGQSSQSDVRGEQSSIQQGVEKAGERLQKAGQKSSLLSARSQRAVGEARQKVQEATKQTTQPGSLSGSQRGSMQQQGTGGSSNPGATPEQQQAMRDAAESLNRAAASLVRDRERANSAKSASGLPEMMAEMGELAQQQGALNAQAQGLSLGMGGKPGSQGQAGARALGQKQRGLAQSLGELGENDESGRADALAKEAAQIAQALEQGSLDRSLLDRQQRLYHRLLEAGRTLQQDEREDTGKRESRSATGTDPFAPGTDKASGKAASRYREPAWNELRGLSAEERRLVLEYFKRLNAQP